jgi:hypothetical protein
MGFDSSFEEPWGIGTIFADGLADVFIENNVLRITYFQWQTVPGMTGRQRVAVARVALALCGVIPGRMMVAEAMRIATSGSPASDEINVRLQ